MKYRNSPLAKTPPAGLPKIPGLTSPHEKKSQKSLDLDNVADTSVLSTLEEQTAQLTTDDTEKPNDDDGLFAFEV